MLPGVTQGYIGLTKGGFKRLQLVTFRRGYRVLQGVTRGYKRLQAA